MGTIDDGLFFLLEFSVVLYYNVMENLRKELQVFTLCVKRLDVPDINRVAVVASVDPDGAMFVYFGNSERAESRGIKFRSAFAS